MRNIGELILKEKSMLSPLIPHRIFLRLNLNQTATADHLVTTTIIT